MKLAAKLILIFFVMSLATIGYAGFQAYSGTTDIGIFDKVKCSTGLTCTRTKGLLTIVSSPVATTVGGFQIKPADAQNGVLTISADNSDDNGDDWAVKALASGNALDFMNDTSGTLASKMSLSTAGVLTLTGAATLSNGEVISNATDDSIRVASDDAAMILDVYTPLATNGDASITLTADAGADNGDVWKLMHTGSSNAFSLQNNTSGSQVAKMTLSTAGAMTSVVSITGAGTGSLSGYLQSQVASTSVGITAAQCGSTFVSNSADVMVLPEASTVLGCRLTFICGTADDFDVNPADATDTIGITGALTPSAGDAIRCTDIGAGFVLQAVGNDLWAVISTNGTITDVN